MDIRNAILLAATSLMLLGASPALPKKAVAPTETQERSSVATVQEMLDEAGNLMDLKHWDEAIQVLNVALEIQPDNGLAYANRALCYAWTNRLDEASRDLADAEKRIPGTAIVHRVRAVIADRRSDDETELQELSKSLALDPGNPMALRFRATIFNRRGREEQALADADAYIRARPDDPDAYAFKARLLESQNKRDLASKEAEAIAARFPGNAYAMSIAAQIYSDLGDRVGALQQITEAITDNPDFFYYYRQRAEFRRWDDLAGRQKDLEAAFALQPDDLGVIADLGVLDFQQKRLTDAVALFSIILTQEPKDFGVLAYRGIARERQGQTALAARDYDMAMAAASGARDFNLVCYSLAKENAALDTAMKACNRAIQLDPTEGNYRDTRGMLDLRLGELDQAFTDFDFAVAADKRVAHPLYGRAIVEWRRGEKDAATADVQHALVLDPLIDEAFRRYGFNDLPKNDAFTPDEPTPPSPTLTPNGAA